jgi:hypothetical protein
VLHFFGVAFADCAADFARLNASPQLCASQFEIGTGEARDDARGRQADIGVIIAIANTRDQLRHVCFGEAGIGAGVAGFRAGIAGRDAFDVNCVIGRRIHRVRLEHLFDVAHEKILSTIHESIAAAMCVARS